MPYQRDPDAKPYDATNDPYIESNGVLKNNLGIKNPNELDKVEADLSSMRAQELENSPLPGKFDLDHLKKIHKHLFGDVYPWAGEIRRVDIAKGNDLFAHHIHIKKEADKLFKQLANENHLKDLSAEKFSERAGYYLSEINALHPFREGNGRSQRAFIGQVAREAGYEIEWSNISREDMTKGSIESFYGDSGRLAKLIQDNLTSEKDDPLKKNDRKSISQEFDKLKPNQLSIIQQENPEFYKKLTAIKHAADIYAKKITDDPESQRLISDKSVEKAIQSYQDKDFSTLMSLSEISKTADKENESEPDR